LNGSGPFTVFAPTNAAFSDLLASLGKSSLDELTPEALTPILLYHVVAGNNVSSGLKTGSVPTIQGSNISVSLGSGVMLNGNTDVIVADVQGSNGVVHDINKVLLPPGK